MKKYILIVFLTISLGAFAQTERPPSPIPVEVMAGNHSNVYQLIVNKRFGPESPFKFFNLISYEIDDNDYTPDDYIIQTIGYYEFYNGFDAGVGTNFKAYGGFKPVVSVEYTRFSPTWGIVVQPVYEVDKDGEFSTLAIVEWHPMNGKKIKPYFRFQGLTAWASEHAFSYHRWRVGAQYHHFRFGPALNVQYAGPDKLTSWNWGAFLNVEIF
ncbi:hypothetical protein [Mangrovibacterium lignilyticum]|uniref:hypothetical protein n=1 Tax=Mangrovibacterium lignilyticum TaxID=2668052 RepID=UPI0013D3ADEB|nr:hypothetical protein [Mangrovibacterium lignilyticum]